MGGKGDDQVSSMRFRDFRQQDDDNFDGVELGGIGDEGDIPVRQTPEQRDLAALMQELGASPRATVTVYRTTSQKGKGAYIMQYPLSSKTLQEVLDYLRDVKKGGDFRFYIHDGTTMRGNQPVIVEPPTPEEAREYEAKLKANNPAYGAAPAVQQNSEIAALLLAMREDSQRRDEEYRRDQERREQERKEEQLRRDQERREEREREQKRAERELEREREDKKFMLTLLTSNKPAPQSGLSEMITALASLKAMEGNQKQPDALEMIDRVMGIRDKLVEDVPSKTDGVAETAIKHLGAPLLTLMAQMNAQKPNPLPARAPQTAPVKPEAGAPESPTLAAPEVPAETPLTEQERLAMLLAEIIQAAQQNADPNPWAHKLIEGLGEDACAEVVDDDQSFDFLMTQLGEAGVTYRPWFDKLRDAMLDLLFEDDDSEDSDGEHTDVSNETGV